MRKMEEETGWESLQRMAVLAGLEISIVWSVDNLQKGNSEYNNSNKKQQKLGGLLMGDKRKLQNWFDLNYSETWPKSVCFICYVLCELPPFIPHMHIFHQPCNLAWENFLWE